MLVREISLVVGSDFGSQGLLTILRLNFVGFWFCYSVYLGLTLLTWKIRAAPLRICLLIHGVGQLEPPLLI